SEGTAYTNPAMTTVAGTWDYVYIDAKGTSEDYAAVNSAVGLSGKIVIMNRGELSFVEKGENVKSYNPKGLIVANNTEGVIHMDLTDFTGRFPYVTITLKDANAIKEGKTANTANGVTYYTGSVQVTTTEVSTVTPREDAEITDFSSWGVPGSLLMKPDITAPGGDIYSVYGIDGSSTTASNQYGLMSGTSMAAPHITGLSAVLMQDLRENAPDNADLMSGYSLRAIAQSLLMSTATPMINQGAFLSILQQGAGLVEVSKAIEAKSVIMMDEAYLTSETNAAADGKVKVELGDDPEKAGEYTYKFTVYNITDKTLEFELGTILFTQAVNGDTLSRKTAILPLGGDSYEWGGQAPAEEHDVDKDGDTDEDDAQAILELVSGNLEEDDESYDFTVADMDGDGMITSRDAKLLLDWEGGAAQEGYFVGPNDKAQVTVHINLTAEQKAALEKEGGAWLEGYTYVDCVTADQEGVSYEHEHTIPILGYFGSFTDASMFDTNSYTENLYGNDQLSYSGNAATSTNYMRITTNGTLAKFSGNPYMVEDNGFPEARLAIRSDAKINDIAYNMIRNAGGTGYAVTKLDGDGNVSDIVYSTVTGQSVEGLWYYVNGGTWQNTMTKTYNVDKALNEYSGINEGDRVRVGFYAIPEYNVMKVSGDMTAADAGTLTASRFTQILTDNVLGKGAFVGFDFTVDDTAPTFSSNPTLNGSTLTVYASDDQNLAYVCILSLDGSVIYKQVAPGAQTAEVSIDATDAIANAQGYVAVFIADYAGNEAAYAVKVNNNTHVEKTVYVLTNTVTAGDDYLIMNRNSAGAGYALYYTLNSSQTTATSGAVATAVQEGTADTNGQPYVESADVAATSVWTAGTGSTNGTFTFNNNGWYLRRNNRNTAIAITKDTSRRDWSWDSTNNRLYYSGRYVTI
ncbi:MAG: S8 family serine peptidase, partial [Clostridia bacterium]|nr:S8 family serine peptidase [Clostridia bacterium]